MQMIDVVPVLYGIKWGGNTRMRMIDVVPVLYGLG